jgi:sugar lactone lactonase YvrE
LRFDPITGDRRPIPVVIDGIAITDINDIEADAAGNLYGGTLDYEAFEEGRPPRPSIVFRLNRDGTADKLAEMPIPNGMDFSSDGDRFFLSESGEGVFTYAPYIRRPPDRSPPVRSFA